MPDSSVAFKDLGTSTRKPRTRDRGTNIDEAVHGVSDNNGNQINPATNEVLQDIKTLLTASLKTVASPLVYTNATDSPVTLSSTWTKVITTTTNTKGLRIVPVSSTSVFDIEWTSVTANDPAPSGSETGEALFGGQDFIGGLPVGDIYLRSATSQKVTIKTVS